MSGLQIHAEYGTGIKSGYHRLFVFLNLQHNLKQIKYSVLCCIKAGRTIIYAFGFCPQQLFPPPPLLTVRIAMETLSCLPQVVCVHDSVQ